LLFSYGKSNKGQRNGFNWLELSASIDKEFSFVWKFYRNMGSGSKGGPGCCGCGEFFLCLLAVFLSPVAVLIKKGCGCEFLVNIILFVLGIVPGIIHAWFCILKAKHFRRLLYTFLAVIMPPLVAFLKHGCKCAFWVNILLTILGWVPGIIHAWLCTWGCC